MHARVIEFLNCNNSLIACSTDLVVDLVNNHYSVLKTFKKEIALLLLIDLSKAFDMIEHDFLLTNLNIME